MVVAEDYARRDVNGGWNVGPMEWNWPASACGITDRDLGAWPRTKEVRRTQRGEE